MSNFPRKRFLTNGSRVRGLERPTTTFELRSSVEILPCVLSSASRLATSMSAWSCWYPTDCSYLALLKNCHCVDHGRCSARHKRCPFRSIIKNRQRIATNLNSLWVTITYIIDIANKKSTTAVITNYMFISRLFVYLRYVADDNTSTKTTHTLWPRLVPKVKILLTRHISLFSFR